LNASRNAGFSATVSAFALIGSIKKTRTEIEVLVKRAKEVARADLPTAAILTDPRLGLAFLISMDFVIATIIIMLTRFALSFVTRPFGGLLGNWIYEVAQGIIAAFLFVPIISNATKLKKMITA
jgi:hypothetical protein